jgi:lysophospholipase L1-like esterase
MPGGRDDRNSRVGVILPLPDSARAYALRPGLGPPFGTNAHGFRGEPVDVAKPAGVRRIVMLGDSITFGNSVAWNQTFSYVLQQILNERAGRREFEVLNLGVSGYNTAGSSYAARARPQFSPDVIVLNVCLNDSDQSRRHQPSALSTRLVRDTRHQPAHPRWASYLLPAETRSCGVRAPRDAAHRPTRRNLPHLPESAGLK